MDYMKKVEAADPAVAAALRSEVERLETTIELIASENIVSSAVMAAQSCEMTNKYAEGYPGNRYYGGCANVDIVENLARERMKELFHAEHANVQPHSGSQANTAVYLACLNPGDTVLALDIFHGGHLTHGNPINISGTFYNFKSYGVDRETERLNYDNIQALAEKYQPKLLVAGASAYPRIIDFARMKEIADSVGAYLMVDMAHIAGLVAADLHPSPIPYADFVTTTTHKTMRGPRGGAILCKEKYAAKIDKAVFPGIQGGPLMHVIAAKAVAMREALRPEYKEYQKQIIVNTAVLGEEMEKNGFRLVSGGTDNHLILVDLTNKGINGKEAETLLDAVGITVNKNMIPFDPLSANTTSGLRMGAAAVTTRGFKEPQMREVADAITAGIDGQLEEASAIVKKLTTEFPLYK